MKPGDLVKLRVTQHATCFYTSIARAGGHDGVCLVVDSNAVPVVYQGVCTLLCVMQDPRGEWAYVMTPTMTGWCRSRHLVDV